MARHSKPESVALQHILSQTTAMAKKTFETALSRLEQITSELEQGELSLEKSLKKFEEGIELVRFCGARLEEARSRVDLLLEKSGHLEPVPFDEKDRGDQSLS